MKLLHKKGLLMSQKRLVPIQNMHNDYMNTAVGIGCLILLPFFLLVAVVVGFLYHVFFRIYTIAQKALSIASLKSIGFRCWAVVSALVSAFAVRMINRLESCPTFAHMTHHLSLIDKVGLAVVPTLLILIFLIQTFFYFLK